MAATLDNFLAMIAGLATAKAVDDQPVLQLVLFVGAYLGYFFLLEAVISRTIGKVAMGLVVVRCDGGRAGVRESAIRTAMRILEVNPAICGAIPAAISIAASEHHQRIGDRMAGTIVIPRDRLPPRD